MILLHGLACVYSYILCCMIATRWVPSVHGFADKSISKTSILSNHLRLHQVSVIKEPCISHPQQKHSKHFRLLMPTALHVTTSLTEKEKEKPIKVHQCKFCSKTFASRNSLFRHIETCPELPKEEDSSEDAIKMKKKRNRSPKRQTFGFRFSYFCNACTTSTRETSTSMDDATEAQIAGKQIQKALQDAIISSSQDGSSVNEEFKILASTQATVANQRHPSLMQEVGCAAANDVMTISFSSRLEQDDIDLQNLSRAMNDILQKEVNGINVRILEWLKNGEELEEWWLQSEESEKDKKIADAASRKNVIESIGTSKLRHPGSFQTKPPSTSLKVLRNALKYAESITVPNRRVRRRLLQENDAIANRKIDKVGTRRMGTITNKERRAFHNFADPRLQGEASPNHEPVWRVLDKCRIAEIKKNPMSNDDEVVAVLEFRGDAFLPQQIRRIVGTAVGITNGWLPENTFDIATRPDISIGTALAPPRRLYLNELRFHFDESNERFCESGSTIASDSTKWMQQQIFSNASNSEIILNEKKWLCELEETVAPILCTEISQVDDCFKPESELNLLDDGEVQVPTAYSRVLDSLRQISTTGWPETSKARSRVIKNAIQRQRIGNEDGENGNERNQFGSFTVVNPRLFQPSESSPQKLPLGNELFPDLVQSIFELEQTLSKEKLNFAPKAYESNSDFLRRRERNASSHCAINFNASFTPHVDSGTGLGQSLSMIVGLGDYKGGEIFVEGKAYPIRYQPLEFDGYKQRHWTANYSGERFSLVWFTPEKS